MSGSFQHDALWGDVHVTRRAVYAEHLYDLIASKGHDPAVWLGICGKEHTFGTNTESVLHRNNTRSWTNARSVRHPDLKKTAQIITDSYRQSNYVKYRSVEDSLLDGMYRVDDPTFDYQRAGATSLLEVIKVWAPRTDKNNPEQYAQTICNWVNAWQMSDSNWTPLLLPTDRMIQALREEGKEVHDVRKVLPLNKEHPYSRLKLSDVKYIIHHWTGSARAVATGEPIYREGMTVEEEMAMLRWYANYHIRNDGGTWGGIAYGVCIPPSGRIYVCHDIGTYSYHAYSANKQSYATCCPNANGQAPTAAQVNSLKAVWDILCDYTPEIPATRKDVWGHGEATFIDPRNTTACPGTFLNVVREYRNGGTVVKNNERYFPETSVSLIWGHKGYFEKLEKEGYFHVVGYPVTPEFTTKVDGVERQVVIYERGAVGWYPESKGSQWEFRHLTRGELWTAVDDARKRGILA